MSLEQPLPSHQKISVLIVEDSEINQRILARFIKEAGYKSRIANNGSEGVELYKKYSFDNFNGCCDACHGWTRSYTTNSCS